MRLFMVCKMLVFDFKEAEKLFFEKNKLENFDVKLLPYSLNKKTINTLLPEDLEHIDARRDDDAVAGVVRRR